MKKISVLFLMLSLAGAVKGQKMKMGDFSQEEIELKEVAFEKDAQAVVLWEEGDSRFFSGMLVTSYYFRVKILSEGAKDRGDIRIPFFHGDNGIEEINTIKAQITNFENGAKQETKLKKENIFKVDLGNGWKEYRISFPDVQVGSIIEYSYKKTDKNITFLDGWAFQNDIPTLASTYQITMIPQLEYRMIGQGEKYNTTTEKVQSNGIYSWTLRDLYSLKAEPFMKNYGDYREKIEFQLSRYQHAATTSGPVWTDVLSDWVELGNDVLDLYQQKGYFRSNPIEKELLNEDFEGTTELEKAQKAYYSLRDNFTLQKETGFTPEQSLSQLLKSKTGTAEELNLAYMGILRSLGITSHPILIGSKGNGRSYLVPFPFLNQFDEIMIQAELDGEVYFLDLSDPLAPFGYVDLEKHVTGGLLLVKNKSELVPVNIKHHSNTIFYSEIKLDTAQNLVMDNLLRSHYYEGLKIAHIAKSLQDKNEPLEKLFKEQEGLAFSEVEIIDELQNKNLITTKFKTVQEINPEEEYLAFKPLSFSNYAQNPFTQDFRVFPIDFEFAYSETYTAMIEIPEGYELDDYPLEEMISIAGNPVIFSYSPQVLKNSLMVVAKFQIKNPLIHPNYYADLKYFMESVASKLSAPVIFKKISKP